MIFRGGEGRRMSCAIKHRSGGLVMLRIEYSYSSLSHWPLEGSGMAQSTVEESVAPTACSASVFRAWCAARGASASQTRRILTLLDLQHFLSLPLPPRTHRLPGVPDWKWGRFLIRRHIQHILLWRERRGEGSANGFSDDLNWIIRRQLFLHPAARDDGEDARRGEGDSQRTSATNVTRSVAPTTEEGIVPCPKGVADSGTVDESRGGGGRRGPSSARSPSTHLGRRHHHATPRVSYGSRPSSRQPRATAGKPTTLYACADKLLRPLEFALLMADIAILEMHGF
jgi:hypothetical protein